jgi:hypothetical protein
MIREERGYESPSASILEAIPENAEQMLQPNSVSSGSNSVFSKSSSVLSTLRPVFSTQNDRQGRNTGKELDSGRELGSGLELGSRSELGSRTVIGTSVPMVSLSPLDPVTNRTL